MTVIESGRHRGQRKPLITPWWRFGKKEEQADLVTGLPAEEQYRLVIMNEYGTVLYFLVPQKVGYEENIRAIINRCLMDKKRKTGEDLFAYQWRMESFTKNGVGPRRNPYAIEGLPV